MDDFPPISEDNKVNLVARRDGESVLDYTQRIRIAAITTIAGNNIPTDAKEVATLNSLLDGLDRQEINKARIDIENSGLAADKEALSLITAVINSVGNSNPYETSNPQPRVFDHEGPVIEGVKLVDGELDHKPRQVNYDGFMKQYKLDNPKSKDTGEDD